MKERFCSGQSQKEVPQENRRKEKEIKGVVNMANISSLSGTTNRAMSSLRGYGGLASGLDRDELIAGMTSGTQTKITKQQQAKTKLQW